MGLKAVHHTHPRPINPLCHVKDMMCTRGVGESMQFHASGWSSQAGRVAHAHGTDQTSLDDSGITYIIHLYLFNSIHSVFNVFVYFLTRFSDAFRRSVGYLVDWDAASHVGLFYLLASQQFVR